MNIYPANQIDFYKADHRRQYNPKTRLVFTNCTPRSVRHAPKIKGVDDKVILFFLQYAIRFIHDSWTRDFFQRPKEEAIGRYKRRMDTSLGKDAIPMDHMEALHDLGYLPIHILGLPEGAAVPAKTPYFVIFNTKPEFFWLTNYLETILSNLTWKPSTSATTAYKYKQLLTRYCNETGGDLSFIPFQAHDFSFRGMNGPYDAASSGAGHLLSFVGTDTIPAIDLLEDFYGANAERELVGCSVAATEHSVMTLDGPDGEFETFKRLITEVYPKGIVSIVSDSFDFWQVITDFLPRLKTEVLARKGGAPIDRVVIRPDSGDPVKIIVGDPNAPVDSPEYKGAIQCLWEVFGGTTTSKGYKVLDSHIGLIYGDSITLERCERIMEGLKNKGFASTNVVLGIGSYTYTFTTRDTYGFALKATAGIVGDMTREIFKDPKTDNGMKKSARGFLAVFKEGNEYVLKDRVAFANTLNCEFESLYKDGKILKTYTLSEIRARVDHAVKTALKLV